jgi:hypothetical protein
MDRFRVHRRARGGFVQHASLWQTPHEFGVDEYAYM